MLTVNSVSTYLFILLSVTVNIFRLAFLFLLGVTELVAQTDSKIPAAAAVTPTPPANADQSLASRTFAKIAQESAPTIAAYAKDLGSLRNAYQANGDLHPTLAVQQELARTQRENSLAEKDVVTEPKELSKLQTDYIKRLGAIRFEILNEVIGYYDQQVRTLTKAGKLTDATSLDKELQSLSKERQKILASQQLQVGRHEGGPVVFVNAPRPDYPYEARSRHITGSGVCLMSIDFETGVVTDATMAQSIGNPILDNAVVSACRRWRAEPRSGTKYRLPITFTMSGASYPDPTAH